MNTKNDLTKTKIIVFGATGNQGGAVAKELLNAGVNVTGLTRDLESEKSLSMESLGVKMVEGNFSNMTSLERAAKGNDFAFIVTMPGPNEAELGINAVKSMVNAGVQHIIFTSVANSDLETGIPHFDSKRIVEEYLIEKNIAHTIIAPAFLMENVFAPWNLPNLRNGIFSQPLTMDKPLQVVSTIDIGQFVLEILKNPGSFLNQRIDIAGDELSSFKITSKLSKVMGSYIRYIEVNRDDVPIYDMRKMFEWLEMTGYSVSIKELHNKYSQIEWTSFDKWLTLQDWSQIIVKVVN